MSEHPIRMRDWEVRATLAGTKTMLRRAVKGLHPDCRSARIDGVDWKFDDQFGRLTQAARCPFGAPGTKLWVREAFSGPWCMESQDGIAAAPPSKWGESTRIWYWADGNPVTGDWTRPRPSIHMPRWASRITLEVEAVRVERLQDISADDARAEGCPDKPVAGAEQASVDLLAKLWFHDLWAQINGQASWDANPWVWCLAFRRVA